MSQPYVYKAVTLTVPTGTAVNLLAALQAVDATIIGAYREVTLQSDPSNTPTTVLIWIGDDQLSASRIGFSLAVGANKPYREGLMAGVPIANIWILGSAASQKLNVELVM